MMGPRRAIVRRSPWTTTLLGPSTLAQGHCGFARFGALAPKQEPCLDTRQHHVISHRPLNGLLPIWPGRTWREREGEVSLRDLQNFFDPSQSRSIAMDKARHWFEDLQTGMVGTDIPVLARQHWLNVVGFSDLFINKIVQPVTFYDFCHGREKLGILSASSTWTEMNQPVHVTNLKHVKVLSMAN